MPQVPGLNVKNPLDDGAKELHALYKSLVKAGFEPDVAQGIVAKTLADLLKGAASGFTLTT